MKRKITHKTNQERKTTALTVCFFAMSAAALFIFSNTQTACGMDDVAVSADTSAGTQLYTSESPAKALDILRADHQPTRWETACDSMPDMTERLHVNPVGNYAVVFNDSNYVHYAEAEPQGIVPINTDADLGRITKPLVHVRSNENFFVAELTHSFPYLIPQAYDLLNDIGRRFNSTLRERGGGDYRLKVTSVLRTEANVRSLRRVNRVAVDSSVHRFGTTFDISYTRFMMNHLQPPYRSAEDLKELLAEVLLQLRDEGRCFVKYERTTGCFHITVRRRDTDDKLAKS